LLEPDTPDTLAAPAQDEASQDEGQEYDTEATNGDGDGDGNGDDAREPEPPSEPEPEPTDVMPSLDHPVVQAVTARQPGIDYAILARQCLAASTGHGNARDRELLAECAVALAELGGFKL
jgi:hypothetical protein